MKRALIAAAALLAAGTASANQDPPVAVNVQNVQPSVAAQIVKHAQDGERSLARYLERVRKTQQLSVEDVTRPADETASIAKRREYRKHAADWHRTEV